MATLSVSTVARLTPAKVVVVEQWPPPRDVHELRQFLGLTNYFRKHMQGYAKVAAPLHRLTNSTVAWE